MKKDVLLLIICLVLAALAVFLGFIHAGFSLNLGLTN